MIWIAIGFWFLVWMTVGDYYASYRDLKTRLADQAELPSFVSLLFYNLKQFLKRLALFAAAIALFALAVGTDLSVYSRPLGSVSLVQVFVALIGRPLLLIASVAAGIAAFRRTAKASRRASPLRHT